MLAWTFSLLSLMSLTRDLARSCSMPSRTLISSLTLLPLTDSILPDSNARVSTPRLASLPVSTSRTWRSLNSSSAKTVSDFSLSLISTRASEPLKSKRFVISLLAWSTALRISTWFTSDTMSNDGMIYSPPAGAVGNFTAYETGIRAAKAAKERQSTDRNARTSGQGTSTGMSIVSVDAGCREWRTSDSKIPGSCRLLVPAQCQVNCGHRRSCSACPDDRRCLRALATASWRLVFLFSFAAMRRRSAFSRMKPSASAWL